MKNLESLFGKFGMTLDDFPTTLGWFRDDLFDRFRPARNSGLNRWIKRFLPLGDGLRLCYWCNVDVLG